MKQPRFKSILPQNQKQMSQSGFTLVEISIVMIIIGLLIGGIFGGMKLIDNAKASNMIMSLKSYESAILTFRGTYNALPGDIRNPNTRIPNCAAAPCATGGNGNRLLAGNLHWGDAIVNTDETFERFLAWQHLAAADLISGVQSTASLEFGEGQPQVSDTGIRLSQNMGGAWVCVSGCLQEQFRQRSLILVLSSRPQADIWNSGSDQSVDSTLVRAIDTKIDDNTPGYGKFRAQGCTGATARDWNPTAGTCQPYYFLGF